VEVLVVSGVVELGNWNATTGPSSMVPVLVDAPTGVADPVTVPPPSAVTVI